MNPVYIYIYISIIIYLSHHHLSNIVTLAQPSSTTIPPPISLNCGSKEGGNDADNREWEPDNKYLVSSDKSITSTALTQEPSLSSDIPYMTARIFTGETSYKFNINSTSRYIIRLHFYPSEYPNYNVSNSFFIVTTKNPDDVSITLLRNFSAFITAEALSQAYLIKEYSLAAFNSDSITLTFKPESKSFAFVNGIELITEPELLFDDQAGLVGVAEGAGTIDGLTSNMQNMFRLNVGGQFIPPTNDSGGLMRSWYDDTPYIFGAGTITHIGNITIDYKDLPEATAPVDVYRTARSQGPDPNINKQSNVTWVFHVDANFTYLVRLHFCEYQLDKINQRVFEIYLNNETAFATADIIAWTGEKGVPTRKDYAIYVGDKRGKDVELWVTLHTNIDLKPEFYDILLNGLEVFKLSDSKSNLAGPNPVPSELMQKQLIANREADDAIKITHVVSGAVGGMATIGVAFVVMFMIRRRRRVPGSDSAVTSWLPIYGHSTSKSTISGKSQCGSSLSTDAVCNCRYFSLVEIKSATNNFEESNVIGVGGFGKVYKGIIDGNMKVAVKRSNPSSEQGVNEFVTEIEMLSKLRHRHLVSLIGFCEEGNEMVLVYDYMGKGTLREHLYKGNKITLTWKQRLDILVGAAKGLHYLHTGAKYTIIHRDVKTTNILCDDNWVAKVSDFGLSKTGPNLNQNHVSTVVKGSFGYLDPEYFRRQQLTEKSDIYSFGVVLFEVLCARPALNPSLPKEQVSLADFALQSARKGTLEEMVDPHLKGTIKPEAFKKFTDCSLRCLADHGMERPSMGDVLWTLEYVLKMETNDEGPRNDKKSGSSSGAVEFPVQSSDMIAMHLNTLSLDSDDDDDDDDDDANGAGAFSQIIAPKGR